MRLWRGSRPALLAVLASGAVTALAATGEVRAALRVCADPGNMPLSNNRGEGLENKLATVLATGLGTTVEYYYRPGVERGLTRTTLDADQCDVMLDMPVGSEDVLTTTALYRTTYVFAYRSDRGITIKSLDDPRLRKLRIGVYETSAIRESLAAHGIGDVEIHYLSHDADLVAAHQPSYQIQEVIDGKLDVAAAWGPLAGYYRARGAPLTIQPANMMDDSTPLQFDMAIGLRRNDRDLERQLEQVMQKQRDALKAVLMDFGVPLVSCDSCIVNGDLPAHGPYAAPKPQAPERPGAPAVSIAQLDDWLAHGANINVELNNAVMADDQARVAYLLERKHAGISSQDLQGETPLHHALLQRSPSMVAFLIAHGADVNERDRDGWTPIMTAAYCDDATDVKALAAHGADPNAASRQNFTPLGIATQYGKDEAALALLESGANPDRPIGDAGYTPLMLATSAHATAVVRALLEKGAQVNARNSGGVTALMIAAAGGRADLVEALVRAGADVGARTERGETALSIARAKGDDNVVRLLGQAPGGPGA